MGTILKLNGVDIYAEGPHGATRLVHRATLELEHGECLGLVGESGSGKSMLLRSIMGLLPRGVHSRGRFEIAGATGQLELFTPRSMRGRRIGMVFQEPMKALNPWYTAGWTVAEPLRLRSRMSSHRARSRALELLVDAGIDDPERVARSYPHQLSGGLRQRVTIAAALATDPEILLCDEPTTALDVTTQARIIALLKSLQQSRGLSLVFVSHDLGVVSEIAQRVTVMRSGRLLETGAAHTVLTAPKHPYTQSLLQAIPSRGQPGERFAVPDSLVETSQKEHGDE